MKVKKEYTKYTLTEGEDKFRFKISKEGITVCNRKKNANRWPHEFQFIMSSPELIDNFGKAFRKASKLAKEEE